MLSFNCNQALGNVRDNLRVLDQLQDYLLRADPKALQVPHVESRLRGAVIELASDYAHAASAR